jgi:hypothetical protein
VITFPFFFVLKRYKDLNRWQQAPSVCPVPMLIVRCPSDEASSGLGFVAIVARIVYHVEHLAAWPMRMLKRHPVKLWLLLTATMIAVATAMGLAQGVEEWFRSWWVWLVLLIVGPWWLGLPLRLLIYGLAYGIDMFGLPLVKTISAEVTPLGHYETWLVPTPDSEELRAAHSEIYELPSVQALLADWFDERIMTERTQRKDRLRMLAELRRKDRPQAS